ncbi:MAG: CBS domain-containing protein [Thermoplasmata archaeon]|nr:CBS domain-containing protein [Thermoplasmata archaeon]
MSEKHSVITELYEVKVKDLLEPINAKILYVEKTDAIEQVFLLLGKKNHVWVVDDSIALHVLGVITESDTLQLFAPPYTPLQSFDKPTLQSFQYGLETTAEEIMSKRPITADPNESIIDVIVKMKQHKIKQLPVVDENERLIGEVSLSRLIQEFSKRQADIIKKKKTEIT